MPLTEDVSSPSSPTSQRAQDAFQEVVKGRKNWKTLRGESEPVWPLQLEAALMDGLENYQPNNSRETRMLGRFPMRNKFISDYIFTATGKRRSAKQVGSRLQQLRDSRGGGRPLLKLLLQTDDEDDVPTLGSPPALRKRRCRAGSSDEGPLISLSDLPSFSDASTSSGSSVSSPTSLPSNSGTSYFGADLPSPRPSHPQMMVYIDILPAWYDRTVTYPSVVPLSPIHDRGDGHTFRPSAYPRPVWAIDPTLTFITISPIDAHSNFTVFVNERVVHTEVTDLVSMKTICTDKDALLYTTPMIPGYWKTICDSADPTQFVIVQDVVPNSAPTMTSPSAPDRPVKPCDFAVVFSATYTFTYPADIQPQNVLVAPPFAPPGLGPSAVKLEQFDGFCKSMVDHPCGATEVRTDGPPSTSGPENIPVSHASSCFPSELFNYLL